MQLKTLQIVWHGKEPVLSVDFQPNSHTLASGGQDGEVKHWEVVVEDDGSPGVRFLSSYPVNSKSVNCVRFSPAGDMLASAGDKGEVLLWRFAMFAAGTATPAVHQPVQPQQQLDGNEGTRGSSGGAAAFGSAVGGDTATATTTTTTTATTTTASGMWRQVGLLRGHCDDVLDLAWAPDGSALLSGGIENNCIVWDVDGRKSLKWLQDHGHYVQGVAWDPLGRYVASQSADRTARVYAVKPPAENAAGIGTKQRAAGTAGGGGGAAAPSTVTSAGLARDGLYAAATLSKGPMPLAPQLLPQQQQQQQQMSVTGGTQQQQHAQQQQQGEVTAASIPGAPSGVAAGISKQPLFCDDSLPTFFRRLAWSPDGAFLAAPAGLYRAGVSAPVTSTTHVFARGDWSVPVLSLPCLSKGALAVRFCPRLFRAPPPQPPQLQSNQISQQLPQPPPQPTGGVTAAAATPSRLPYRIIMAVASVDSVVLYDMQALEALAILGGIHFAAVTDLAWSDDGKYLVVASRDGYCTVCSFEDGELGEPVPLEELPPGVAAAVSRAAARRYHERTVAAAVAAAAAKSIAAAVTAAAANPAVPSEVTEEQPSIAATAVVAAPPLPQPPSCSAAPRRIQPIAVTCAGDGHAVSCADAGGNTAAAVAYAGGAAGVKRPADALEPSTGAGVGDPKPKTKRIQPIPLSATALSAVLPTAAGGPGRAREGGAATAAGGCGVTTATNAAPPVAAVTVSGVTTGPAAAAVPSPARRRIMPTRVDASSGTTAAVATSGPVATAGGGLSPLPSTISVGVIGVAAPSCTPITGVGCGGDRMIVPGVAAPGSGLKMPTPQVLVFGTPPSSTARPHHGGGLGGGGDAGAVSEPPHASDGGGGGSRLSIAQLAAMWGAAAAREAAEGTS